MMKPNNLPAITQKLHFSGCNLVLYFWHRSKIAPRWAGWSVLGILSYVQAKILRYYLKRAMYTWISSGEQLAPIKRFSVTLGFEEILIGIVAETFERFPSTNTGSIEKGFLNQSHSFRMVNSGSNYSEWSVVGRNDDLWWDISHSFSSGHMTSMSVSSVNKSVSKG